MFLARQKGERVSTAVPPAPLSPEISSVSCVDMDSVQMEMSSVAEPFVSPPPPRDLGKKTRLL